MVKKFKSKSYEKINFLKFEKAILTHYLQTARSSLSIAALSISLIGIEDDLRKAASTAKEE